MRRWLLCLTVAGAACVSNLPEQDLRILAAQPYAKLSASDLWKDFQTDSAAATKKYFGKAVDVSDKPTAIETAASKGQHFFFGQAAEHGVRARLLDEKAAEILKEAKVGERLTLRCFCQGMDGQDVLLKSCIRP
jgi:tRNA_anti-like